MASCSQDDALQQTTESGGDLQEYTLTIGIDHSMEGDTRATSTTDDDPTRCFMQVFDESGASVGEIQQQTGADSYSFTVKLAADSTYTFCFWADNSEESTTSLTEVPYTIGTVAFAKSATGTAAEVIADGITLTHAVTKLTLKTSTATTIASGSEASIATTCATRYNVQTGTGSGGSTQTYTSTISGSLAAGDEAASCYLIPTDAQQDVTLGCHVYEQTIADVPLAANTHVTLQGDLSESNENWELSQPRYYYNIFYNCFFDSEGKPTGTYRTGDYCYYATYETVNKLVTQVLKGTMPSSGWNNSVTITPPWGGSVTILNFGTDYYIQYNGYAFIIYTDSMHQYHPTFTLPDEIL